MVDTVDELKQLLQEMPVNYSIKKWCNLSIPVMEWAILSDATLPAILAVDEDLSTALQKAKALNWHPAISHEANITKFYEYFYEPYSATLPNKTEFLPSNSATIDHLYKTHLRYGC